MSGSSDQEKAAGEQSALTASLSRQLSNIATPELERLIGDKGLLTDILKSTSGGQVKSSLDQKVYDDSLKSLNDSFATAKTGTNESIRYGALRSGEDRRGAGVVPSAMGAAALTLDRDRTTALNRLKFESDSQSMTNYNNLLKIFGQGVNTTLSLGQGASGVAGGAIPMLSQNSQFGSALGGAASGAALGSTVLPGWGTVIGGVAGGVIGAVGGG